MLIPIWLYEIIIFTMLFMGISIGYYLGYHNVKILSD